MKDKHPIDKLFKDGLHDPEIPFDPRDWETLSKKIHPRKKRRMPLLIWMTSGVAAALVLAIIFLFSERQASTGNTNEYAAGQTKPGIPNSPDTVSSPDAINPNVSPSIHDNEAETETLAVNEPIHRPTSKKATDNVRSYPGNLATLPKRIPVVALTPSLAIASEKAISHLPNEPLSNITPKGWALSVIAAPDLSGTQPVSGKLSGNVGILATYRLNHWLSISGGALYAKKLYQADFSHYRPDRWRGNGSISPGFVKADCAVLDIPILANATIKRFRRADFFVSTGISSYFMLRETYDYRYPPETGREPWELTVRSQNRHLLGVGNLSVGYRQQLTPSLSLTVQPFVKVPLTGIGNGNIKLYSTGVAISADIDLTRRNR